MRIEIDDSYGCRHQIDSADPALIGKWFAEKAEQLISANVTVNHPLSLNIWPATEHEHAVIGQWSVRPMTQNGLLELAQHILNAAERIGQVERGWDQPIFAP